MIGNRSCYHKIVAQQFKELNFIFKGFSGFNKSLITFVKIFKWHFFTGAQALLGHLEYRSSGFGK